LPPPTPLALQPYPQLPKAGYKAVPCWHVGGRDGGAAIEFIDDPASRLVNRVQITTDGLKAYIDAIDTAFGGELDYAVLIKLFGERVA